MRCLKKRNSQSSPITQGLAIVSELCEGPGVDDGGWQFYDYDLPDDQYASVTIASLPTDENGFTLWVRATNNGENASQIPGYKLEVFQFPGNCEWRLDTPASGEILSGFVAAINPGDVFTLAAVGTTIYVFQNSTLLGSIADTSYSSGVAGLECDASEVHISNFAIGSAAVPGSGSLPFLGSVRIVAEAPAGSIPDPFLGTVKVIDSAPAGMVNPYLGNARVVTQAPAGSIPNPTLGNVVIVDSAPAGSIPDPYLGNLIEG
jgi:hypothetical protein